MNAEMMAPILLMASLLGSGVVRAADDVRPAEIAVRAERLNGNPIIRPEMSKELGSNINGPSLIKAPSWVGKPLGKYYLYFAHHAGKSIRLAYADRLEGPWTLHEPGVLGLDALEGKGVALTAHDVAHIASPDVLVDEQKKEIRMYFHGAHPGYPNYKPAPDQPTAVATSKDGLTFTPVENTLLGPFYFRVFRHKDWYYAIAKGDTGGLLLRSKDGVSPFEQVSQILPRMRHAAVKVDGDALYIFYSRIGDAPERILMSVLSMQGDPGTWTPSPPYEVLEPKEKWEGMDLPVQKSRSGAGYQPLHELRDPAYFQEDGQDYLLYSVAGETGIAIAKMKIDLPLPADGK